MSVPTNLLVTPMNLMQQVGILSLAQQDVIKDLEVNDISAFVGMYLTVPNWVLLMVPVRLLAVSLVSLLRK